MSRYEHTQRSPLHLLLLAGAAVLSSMTFGGQEEPTERIVLLCVSGLFVFFAACFAHLTIRDDVERLTVRYGPLPLFGTNFLWSEIESAEAAQSSWIDGWGIHWFPGRGTTYNLWGFDCVVLRVKGKVVRVGTDDSEILAQFIRSRISIQPTTSTS